ncbi:FAD-dependent oxidoreductase [Herbiconiux sp. A18JL235]|uniref:FAD-dependent oxidoreductase n=1 Tax=Herbiconiux sp. A18JL235 TaxID=3152363 RepID=A0AB39BG85_9MICO
MTSLWLDGRTAAPSTPFVDGAVYDDVIVGAGLTGLTTAVMLARAGRRVVVLEALGIGALATGNTTGKVSLLQGSRLSTIRSHHSRRLLRAYVESNRDGQEWLLGFADESGVPYEQRTAYSYSQHDGGASAVDDEYRAARQAGLDVSLVSGRDLETTFPFAFGVALPGQAQLDAMDVLEALVREFLALGGVLHTGARVTSVRASKPVRVTTPLGAVFGRTAVLATATPILDRGLYFAKTTGLRSYALAFELPDARPADLVDGMFLSVGDSAESGSRSLRTATRATDGQELLVVGGNGHTVGRPGAKSEAERLDQLRAWTGLFFPGAVETNAWSAQDYESHNLIPFVGALPRGRGRVYLATGYAKWGLTNGVAAALRLRSEILGEPRRERAHWHRVLGTRVTRPADLGKGAVAGAEVGAEAVAGWWQAETRVVPVPRPAEGAGVVARSKGRPVGVSTVGGTTCAVSAVCPHLGGVLEWNDAERSWDCPLHASRFTASGTRIEGPALSDLEQLPRTPAERRAARRTARTRP